MCFAAVRISFSAGNLSPQNGKQKTDRRFCSMLSFGFGSLSSFCWVQVHRVHIACISKLNSCLDGSSLRWDSEANSMPKTAEHRTKDGKGWTAALFPSERCLRFSGYNNSKLWLFFCAATKRHGNKCVTYCVPFLQAILCMFCHSKNTAPNVFSENVEETRMHRPFAPKSIFRLSMAVEMMSKRGFHPKSAIH